MMIQRTPLYEAHLKLQAKMVDFSGWEMPIHYGSQIEEHHTVRQDAGMFDVSHMCVIDLKGENTKAFLEKLLANDINKIVHLPGKALYSCMLNDNAGIIDDLIVYYLEPNFFRLVVNAGTRDKDLQWINQQAKMFDVTVTERKDLAIIAVQGPKAREKVHSLFSEEEQNQLNSLKIFQGSLVRGFWVARTGYTGEDGYEIIVPASQVAEFWQALLTSGVKACGLGARDTLRLEAGMNLYGSDMDESKHPLESNLAWTVPFEPLERNFIGREKLEQIKNSLYPQLIGLILEDKGVMRAHQEVITEEGLVGEITSGTFSPSLQKSIAFARIPQTSAQECFVDIRGKKLKAKIVKPVFVRQGKILVDSK